MIRQSQIIPAAIIFFFTFILYANTLNHRYALDDSIVITENQFTKEGIKGIGKIFTTESFTGFFKTRKNLVQGGRYRPLSIATFALENQFFREKPSVSHLINILLYAITGILLWSVMKIITEGNASKGIQQFLPLFAALLFIFHPVHTEVVANIKGRDEILALLFSLITLYFALRYAERTKIRSLIFCSLSFFLALLSKENAVTFLVVVPLTLIYFRRIEKKKTVLLIISLIVPLAIWLVIRTRVAGGLQMPESAELMNNPFLYATTRQKYATIVYTLGYYIKLLFFPHPLTFDYYPYHIGLQNLNLTVITILTVYLIMIVFALTKLTGNIFSKSPGTIPAFSVLYFLITLFPVSNIPFTMGTFMNERFIYFSSLAFCILGAWALTVLPGTTGYVKNLNWALLTVILLLYAYMTIDRNKAWKDNYTLFTTDVKTSANSAKSNCSAGGIIYETALKVTDKEKKSEMLSRASMYLMKALKIYPRYADAWRLLGNVSYESGNPDIAMRCYFRILEMNPGDRITWQNAEGVLGKYENNDQKISYCTKLLQIDSSSYAINYMLGNVYGKYKNDLKGAIKYLKKAYTINQKSFEACKDLGVAYGLSGNYVLSAEWFNRALNLNPGDADTYTNLGITWFRLGDVKKAQEYFRKGKELK